MEAAVMNYSVYSPKDSKSINTSAMKNCLIHIIPLIFKKIADRNKTKKRSIPSAFDLVYKLNIEFEEYVDRLINCTNVEVGTIIYSLSLIDKLGHSKKHYLTYENMHKTFIASLLISIKLHEDKTFEEDHYVFSSGMSAKELARLEHQFLTLLDYKLSIKDEDYHLYLRHCIETIKK